MVTKFCFAGPEQNRTDVQASRKVSKNFSGRGGAGIKAKRCACRAPLAKFALRRRAPQRKTLRSAASPRARGVVFSSRLFAAPLREKSVNKKLLKKQKPRFLLFPLAPRGRRKEKGEFCALFKMCAPKGRKRGKNEAQSRRRTRVFPSRSRNFVSSARNKICEYIFSYPPGVL